MDVLCGPKVKDVVIAVTVGLTCGHTAVEVRVFNPEEIAASTGGFDSVGRVNFTGMLYAVRRTLNEGCGKCFAEAVKSNKRLSAQGNGSECVG